MPHLTIYTFCLFCFRLYEVVETLGRVYLVTEYIQGGELYNRITEEGPLTEAYAASLFKQLLHAVQHMVGWKSIILSIYCIHLYSSNYNSLLCFSA